MTDDREKNADINGPSRSGSSIDEKVSPDDLELVHGDFKRMDVGLKLVTGHSKEPEVTPDESKRLRRKIDWNLLPLLCAIYMVQFVDKGTLATSSILGLLTDNNLSTNEYNTLGSSFYIGYLVFVLPQNWALQVFPVARWLTLNIFLWCLFLGLHAVCKNFGGLFILRFLLGASEGSIAAGLMLVCGMFYTRTEIGERLGWTFQCNGLAVIVSSFLQFAMVHASSTATPNQWQWLYLITTMMTFVVGLSFLFFFPDNPTNARFLKAEERLKAVRRVQSNQNGIETKTWKVYQVREALWDPKTWYFAFFAGFANLIGGIGVQYSLVINAFGFTVLETSLLSIPLGVAQIVGITTACYALRKFPNSRAIIGVIGWIPAIIGCLIEMCTPLDKRVPRLIGIYFLYLGSSPCFIMAMSWVTSTFSGHTKKSVARGFFLVGGALGQICSTQFWKDKYKPSYRVPFGIILMSHCVAAILMLVARFRLDAENKRRDRLKAEAEKTGIGKESFEEWAIVEVEKDGKIVKEKIDKTFLDLTDGENLAFRYVL
ncbi:hypothetical protein ACEPAF_1402 [Sanghuangporus sanghuang]